MTKAAQLDVFNTAYDHLVEVVSALSADEFLRSSGGWAPRDIVAHLIGWNYGIQEGCQQISRGTAPSYHADGPNDYRAINAGFLSQYASTDRADLLKDLAQGKAELTDYLRGVSDADWDKDFGAGHYRGGPATIARSLDSLTRDYVEHAAEIAKAA